MEVLQRLVYNSYVLNSFLHT